MKVIWPFVQWVGRNYIYEAHCSTRLAAAISLMYQHHVTLRHVSCALFSFILHVHVRYLIFWWASFILPVFDIALAALSQKWQHIKFRLNLNMLRRRISERKGGFQIKSKWYLSSSANIWVSMTLYSSNRNSSILVIILIIL